jgi:FAD-linked oxidoreductase
MAGRVWRNWSGGVKARPAQWSSPTSLDALQDAVAKGPAPIRIVGSGHSFTPLVATHGALLSLDNLAGVIECDPSTRQASMWGGTKIHAIGIPLKESGLALANQGDIDVQSIAGAIGTGTHGTGATLGSLSTQIVAMTLVTADGGILEVTDHDKNLFDAARVSFGALGVTAKVTLQCRPAYKLKETNWVMTPEECFANLENLTTDNRHFEFFWFPYAENVMAKSLNDTDEDAREPRPPEARSQRRSEAAVLIAINELGRWLPPLTPVMHRYITNQSAEFSRVRWSCEAFPSARNVRFNEMEYAVPLESGPDCLREIADLWRVKKFRVGFPIEYRVVKGDDIWLSPFYQRDSVTISVHQYAKQSYGKFFNACEAIFRSYGGRPHWGKLHTARADEFATLYPKWSDFLRVRSELDPKGRFLNDHLKAIFGAA